MTRKAIRVHLRERPRKTGTAFFLDFYLAGKRWQETLDIFITDHDTKDSAKQKRELTKMIRSRRELEMLHHREGVPASHEKKQSLIECLEQIRQEKQVTNHDKALKWFARYADDRHSVAALTVDSCTLELLQGFERYLMDSAVSRNYTSMLCRILKTMLRRVAERGLIGENVLCRWKPVTREETEMRYLTEDELSRLASARSDRPEIKASFLFAICTGLRFSDVIGLTWGQVHGNAVEVRQKKTRGLVYIPLNEDARIILGRQRGGTLPPVSRKVFDLQSKQVVWRALRRWAAVAGVEPFSFHCSRHSAATRLLNAGADIATIRAILGHRTLEMSLRYARIIDTTKTAAVDRVPRLIQDEER